MENIDEITDTGDIGDLKEADQLPVKTAGEESNPLCYICNSVFTIFDRTERLTTGVYHGKSMMADKRFWYKWAWDRYYRLILFHQKNHICRLSGISCFNSNDYSFYTRQAPWNENTGIVRSESNPSMHKELLATALQYEARHLFGKDRLMCLVVHNQCWRLLCRHKAWSLSGGDIRIVMRALLCKSARYWKQPLYSLEDSIGAGWPLLFSQDDPFQSDDAQGVIRRARRRTRKRFQVIRYGHEETYLSRLPPEILLLIANLLPSTDVTAVQKAMGSYFGDAYWRSRIPNFFHEVQEVFSENLDWEYLCIGLEQLESKWDEQLESRRYVLKHLDEIASFIANDSNNA